ncbi:MAG: glycosyl transferase [Oceanicaulis sp.]|nr:glycosyl transferase [Oceanicaulis sp.]|tara:strand:+ start:478 stop:1380 length:903 start_codon:yes stop_codon:yes gene_type:complete
MSGGTDVDQPVRSGISAVIVTFRTGDVLLECVDSVLAAPDVDELVLVNHDNPSDMVDQLEQRARHDGRLKLIHTGANLGFSRGCNIGAKSAQGDVLLFLNPDAVLKPGDAIRLRETLQGRTEPAIIGARLIGPDGKEQRGARRGALTLGSAFTGFLGLSCAFHREHEPLPGEPVQMPTVSGAAMVMTRHGFEILDGFDEGYFLHVEDIDICKRARDAGGEVVFEPRVEIAHVGSTSKISQVKVEIFKALGLARYFTLHGGLIGPVQGFVLGPVFLLGALARSLVSRLQARSGAKLSATDL